MRTLHPISKIKLFWNLPNVVQQMLIYNYLFLDRIFAAFKFLKIELRRFDSACLACENPGTVHVSRSNLRRKEN